MDFGSFWDSGRAAIEGTNPYTWGPHTFVVMLGNKAVFNFNLNPPPALLFFAPLSYLDPDLSYLPLYGISLCLFLWILSRVYRTIIAADRSLFFLWSMSLPALWDTLKLGQIYIFLAAISLAAMTALAKNRGHTWGLWMGVLIAIKPNFGAILLFGKTRDWIPKAITAIVVALLLHLAATSLFGVTTYVQWYEAVTRDLLRLSFPTNLSLPGLVSRLTNTTLGNILTPLCILTGLYLLRTTEHLEKRLKIGLLVSIIASPIGWIHYLLIAFPVFTKFKIDGLGLLIMTLYLAPISSVVMSYYQPSVINTLMSYFYPAATCLLLYKIVRDPEQQ